jgi:hypothetical protein
MESTAGDYNKAMHEGWGNMDNLWKMAIKILL